METGALLGTRGISRDRECHRRPGRQPGWPGLAGDVSGAVQSPRRHGCGPGPTAEPVGGPHAHGAGPHGGPCPGLSLPFPGLPPPELSRWSPRHTWPAHSQRTPAQGRGALVHQRGEGEGAATVESRLGGPQRLSGVSVWPSECTRRARPGRTEYGISNERVSVHRQRLGKRLPVSVCLWPYHPRCIMGHHLP